MAWLLGLALAVSFDLRDTTGRRHTAAETRESRAVVFVFLDAGCPLSARYVPEIRRLHAALSPRGVAFFAVQPEPSAAFELPFPALVDPALSLALQSGATTTPEAAVISPAGRLLYRGRIDDRVADFGKRRSEPRRRDLETALEEIVSGRPVSEPRTKAFGCALALPRKKARGAVTFNRDVAPILDRHCAQCHRKGGAAPFPLLTYADAAPRAALIAAVTASRYMPPWKPRAGYAQFQGERRLAEAEIGAIRRWVAGGAAEGHPADRPKPPEFPSGWRLGTPDVEVRMPQPYAIAATGADTYQCFVVPLGLAQDRYVRAIEFRPQKPALVHHALLFQDSTGTARHKDAAEPGPGYRCFGGPGYLPAGGLGGWSPGAPPFTLPEGAAMTLRKGADLVLQLHFQPAGRPQHEQSSIGLYFTDQRPKTRVVDIALGSRDIDIPAGASRYKVRDRFTLPVAVDAIGVIPHAHYVARDMKGFAVLPDGRKLWLLWIDDWDFNWQDQYRYASPIRLPGGTRLEMEFTYDNSAGNPRNPSHPPRRVVWGADSTDEMAGLHIQAIPARMSDMPELTQALWGKFIRSVGGGFFQLERQ